MVAALEALDMALRGQSEAAPHPDELTLEDEWVRPGGKKVEVVRFPRTLKDILEEQRTLKLVRQKLRKAGKLPACSQCPKLRDFCGDCEILAAAIARYPDLTRGGVATKAAQETTEVKTDEEAQT